MGLEFPVTCLRSQTQHLVGVAIIAHMSGEYPGKLPVIDPEDLRHSGKVAYFAFVDDAVDNDAAASAAAADAFVDDAASVDTSVCSERHTEWVWRSGLDVSELVDDWGWEDALAERKKRLLAEFVGEDD